MSDENVELVRQAFEAFNRGDLDSVAANVAPDAEYVTSGAIPGAGGVYRGPQGVKRLFGWLREEFDDVRVDAHDLIGAGDQVLVSMISRGRGKKSGVEASWTTWQLWTLLDGKMVRGKGFTSRQEALEAAGLSEQRMSRENVEIVRQVYERFNERDMDAAWELIAADAKFRFIVWGPDMARTYEGRDATTEFWREEVFSVFPDFRMEPEAMVDVGDYVVATVHNTGRGEGSGIEVDMRTAVLAEIRDAKLVKLEVFATRAEALEAADLSGQCGKAEG